MFDGPKACGETETARKAARSEVLLDVDGRAPQTAAVDPGLVLEGPGSRQIDEWQERPRSGITFDEQSTHAGEPATSS